jgi:hypothetical protein
LSLNGAVFNPVVEYGDAPLVFAAFPLTVGYSFSTTQTFTIDALGIYADGEGNARQVGIWDSSGNLLTSTTVQASDPVQGHFQYGAVNYTLLPGSYVIAGEYLGALTAAPVNATGVVTLPGYVYGTDLQNFGAGLNFPTLSLGVFGENGILYPTFSVAQVPEPGSGALLLSAVAFGWFLRRRGEIQRSRPNIKGEIASTNSFVSE